MPIRPASVLDEQIIICGSILDDGSLASTEEVECFTQPKKIPRTVGKKFHRVSFNESANVCYTNLQICKEETKVLWCRGADYQIFKNDHMNTVKDIFSAEIENHTADSYMKIMEHVFEACCYGRELTESEKKKFENILNAECVGLERLTVSRLRLDKESRRQELVDIVDEIQEEYCSRPTHELADMISNAVQEIARPSVLFAAHLARALQRIP